MCAHRACPARPPPERCNWGCRLAAEARGRPGARKLPGNWPSAAEVQAPLTAAARVRMLQHTCLRHSDEWHRTGTTPGQRQVDIELSKHKTAYDHVRMCTLILYQLEFLTCESPTVGRERTGLQLSQGMVHIQTNNITVSEGCHIQVARQARISIVTTAGGFSHAGTDAKHPQRQGSAVANEAECIPPLSKSADDVQMTLIRVGTTSITVARRESGGIDAKLFTSYTAAEPELRVSVPLKRRCPRFDNGVSPLPPPPQTLNPMPHMRMH